MNRTQIGVIGAGAFACRYHIPELLQRDDCELTAIVKRDETTRKQVQERFRVPHAFSDYRDLLDHVTLDGVIICTPHHLHEVHVKACLERHIPVLVEKPFTLAVAKALELTRLAHEKKLPLLVAYNRRVDASYREAAKIIASGGIGEIRFIEGRRFTPLEWMLAGTPPPTESEREKWWPEAARQNFRADPAKMGEGFLVDGGTHIIDAVLWLSGSPPQSVQALMNRNKAGLEIRSTLNLQMDNGLLAAIVSCGDTQPILPYELILHGSEGALLLAKELLHYQRDGKEVPAEHSFPHTTTTGHFIDVIQGKAEPLCSAETAVMPIAVAHAAFQSAQSGDTVLIQTH